LMEISKEEEEEEASFCSILYTHSIYMYTASPLRGPFLSLSTISRFLV